MTDSIQRYVKKNINCILVEDNNFDPKYTYVKYPDYQAVLTELDKQSTPFDPQNIYAYVEDYDFEHYEPDDNEKAIITDALVGFCEIYQDQLNGRTSKDFENINQANADMQAELDKHRELLVKCGELISLYHNPSTELALLKDIDSLISNNPTPDPITSPEDQK